MKLFKENRNNVLYFAIFLAAILAFVITITVKTNLDAIKQKGVYILIYSIFVLICVLPFSCLFAVVFKHKGLNKDNVVFICILAIITFVIAIFAYGDGSTTPGGTENIFQYATVKLYKQHFRYVLIFLFGASAFGQLISAVSLKSKLIKRSALVCQYAQTLLYLVALVVNLILSVNYFNYVQAVATLICDLSVVVIGLLLTVFIFIKSK